MNIDRKLREKKNTDSLIIIENKYSPCAKDDCYFDFHLFKIPY